MNRVWIARTLWLLHLAALLTLGLWACADPLFEPMLGWLSQTLLGGERPDAWLAAWNTAFGPGRLALLIAILSVAAATAGGWFAALLARGAGASAGPNGPSAGPLGGPSAGKSLRSLVAVTAVAALWCALAVNYQAIAWQGKRARMVGRVVALEALAEPLRAEFPRGDGDLPALGSFMAYPFGTPSVLVLLQPPCVGSGEVCIAAVQRGERGDLKFQLTGIDGGDWAEWHPPGSQPASFVGGLGDRHQLQSSLGLGQGWHLVRYREPRLRDQESIVRSTRKAVPAIDS